MRMQEIGKYLLPLLVNFQGSALAGQGPAFAFSLLSVTLFSLSLVKGKQAAGSCQLVATVGFAI